MSKGADRRTYTDDRAGEEDFLPRVAAAGGLLGALAASSCCILPLALFALGAGGAWVGRLTALAPYQPVFIVVALGFLGYGFWAAYSGRTCAGADNCARPIGDRLLKAGLWTSTAIVAAAIGFPLIAPILLGT